MSLPFSSHIWVLDTRAPTPGRLAAWAPARVPCADQRRSGLARAQTPGAPRAATGSREPRQGWDGKAGGSSPGGPGRQGRRPRSPPVGFISPSPPLSSRVQSADPSRPPPPPPPPPRRGPPAAGGRAAVAGRTTGGGRPERRGGGGSVGLPGTGRVGGSGSARHKARAPGSCSPRGRAAHTGGGVHRVNLGSVLFLLDGPAPGWVGRTESPSPHLLGGVRVSPSWGFKARVTPHNLGVEWVKRPY
ncbi:unnamed protein product [Nyctereutes procyonoides]|uniref:(raccoon dog) hypothetical protein n=1 Tax=Nyctereutes procyonoides TaxID=34880 RepID=A0A811ZR38_NYCPR|nr:unnamed protein product [Nyctereutes procyonoides]